MKSPNCGKVQSDQYGGGYGYAGEVYGYAGGHSGRRHSGASGCSHGCCTAAPGYGGCSKCC